MEEKTWNLKDDGFSFLGDSKAPLLPPNIQKVFQDLQDCEHNKVAFERFSDGFVSLIDFFRATCSRIDSSVLNIINFL